MRKSKETARVEARVSLEMKTKLIELADKCGGITNFIRVAIEMAEKDETAMPIVGKKKRSGADIHASSWHLSRIGNSLNQMAYNINKASLSGKVDDKLTKEMIKELMYLNIKINTLIEKI